MTAVSSKHREQYVQNSLLNLSENDLDTKIKKTRNHIANLSEKLGDRNTHGGKVYRERKANIQLQIDLTKERLSCYENVITKIRTPKQNQPQISENIAVQQGAIRNTANIQVKSSDIFEQYHPKIIEGIGVTLLENMPVVSFESLQFTKANPRDPDAIDPHNLPSSAARGITDEGLPFITIRCAPLNKYNMQNAFVVFCLRTK